MTTRGVLIESEPRGLTVGELELPELGPDDMLVGAKGRSRRSIPNPS